MPDFKLHRNTSGRLVYTSSEGKVQEGVVPVHAFPISAPAEGVALVNQDGHELAWIANWAELSVDIRTLLEQELASREFIPEINKIRSVSTFATPSVWEVDTDRGSTTLILRGEDDIRRLNHASLLIADSNGIHYLIRDTQQLDKNSRRLLDRFL